MNIREAVLSDAPMIVSVLQEAAQWLDLMMAVDRSGQQPRSA